jgi:myo-inositol catabolism protein IolC
MEGDQHLYDLHLRPSLMIAAIKELQGLGVEPDVWKIEGLDRREDADAVAAATRHDGRDKVGCILLGRGSSEAGIVAWLEAAAPLPAYIGFAVGRTSFWNPLVGLRDKKISRDAAVAQIADNYMKWVGIFQKAKG